MSASIRKVKSKLGNRILERKIVQTKEKMEDPHMEVIEEALPLMELIELMTEAVHLMEWIK